VIARALVALAILWPSVAAAALASETRGEPSAWTHAVRLVGSRVCHQRPERSFHTAGVKWPVCARCSGLYLGGAAAGWLGLVALASPRGVRRIRSMLLAAAAPTIATMIAEVMFGAPVSNTLRFSAALPLGAVLTALIVRTAAETPEPIR
jgi:uncharacterized membrane protein